MQDRPQESLEITSPNRMRLDRPVQVSADQPSASLQTKRVLLADDNPRVLKVLAARLELMGLEVITASDGYTSLAKAVGESPDLLILDVNMPAGDGFSVQERLKKAGVSADVPVIYLTGDKSERLDRIARNIGAMAIHHKPFKMSELLQDVERALRPPAA